MNKTSAVWKWNNLRLNFVRIRSKWVLTPLVIFNLFLISLTYMKKYPFLVYGLCERIKEIVARFFMGHVLVKAELIQYYRLCVGIKYCQCYVLHIIFRAIWTGAVNINQAANWKLCTTFVCLQSPNFKHALHK